MTFLQLCQRFRDETGMGGTQGNVTNVGIELRVANWINEAWLALQKARRWRWMWSEVTFSTVIGQRDYSSADAAAIGTTRRWDREFARIEDSNSVYYDIQWMPYPEFRQLYERQAAQSARPSNWTVLPNGSIRFDTKPTAVETVVLSGWAEPTSMTANADEPAMGSSDHMIIVWAAIMYYAQNDSSSELYEMARMKYRDAFQSLSEAERDEWDYGPEPLA